jgi:hypothetical protein
MKLNMEGHTIHFNFWSQNYKVYVPFAYLFCERIYVEYVTNVLRRMLNNILV